MIKYCWYFTPKKFLCKRNNVSEGRVFAASLAPAFNHTVRYARTEIMKKSILYFIGY